VKVKDLFLIIRTLSGTSKIYGQEGTSRMGIFPTCMKHNATGFTTHLGHFRRVWESRMRTRSWKSGWRRLIENARTY